MFWLHVSVWYFDGFFVWVVSLLAGDRKMFELSKVVVVVVVVVVIGQTVGSISSRTLAYDCLCTLELCTASMIATS